MATTLKQCATVLNKFLSMRRSTRFCLLIICAVATGCATVPFPTAPATTPGAPPAALPAPPPVPAPPQFGTLDQERITRLLTTLRDFVNTAPDLARVRWAGKQPAMDPVLDKRLIDMAAQLVPLHKAPPETTARFIQAQIDALNYAKQGFFDQWQTTPSTLPVRPGAQARAEGLIGNLVKQFADAQTALALPGARNFVDAKANELLPERSALSTPIRRMVTAPLLEVATR
jgi:hypothetical protein